MREPNWQPIGMLPVLLDLVSGMVDGAREQEQLLRDAPRYSLDTETLDGVERVYRDGAADNAVFAQQLARWQRDYGDAQGLAEFAVVVAELAPAYTRGPRCPARPPRPADRGVHRVRGRQPGSHPADPARDRLAHPHPRRPPGHRARVGALHRLQHRGHHRLVPGRAPR